MGERSDSIRTALKLVWDEFRETTHSADPATRALTWTTAAMCLGTGLFYAVSAIFFATVIGLSAAQIGAGLACAGVAGVLGALGGGYVAARVGSRRVLIGCLLLLGAATACYTLAGDLLAFALLASLISALRFAGTTARASLIASVYTGPDRVKVRARLRVVTNVSIGAGALLAGVALAVGTATAFTVTVVAVGALTALSALPMASRRVGFGTAERRAETAAAPATPGRRPQSPFRDPRYLAVAALVGVNATYFALIEVGVPLWVTQHTSAPDVIVSVLLAANTVVIVLTQTAASKGSHEVRTAGRSAFRGAALIAGACLVFALTGVVGVLVASGLLLLAVLLMSGGEAFGEAGAWGLTMELADPDNQPRYQGVAEMAYAAGGTLGPLLISVTALAHGAWGWIALAAMFLASGGGLYLLSRAGERPVVEEAAPVSTSVGDAVPVSTEGAVPVSTASAQR